MDRSIDRRAALKAATFVGVAALGATAAEAQTPLADDTSALEAAFRAAFSTPKDQPTAVPAAQLAFLHGKALVIASDVPFLLNRASYADHLEFQAPLWERMEVQLLEVKTVVHGSTGVISAYFNLRGKPKDAGFRQRPGYMTAVCAKERSGWRAIGLHLSPLMAQIIDASPG